MNFFVLAAALLTLLALIAHLLVGTRETASLNPDPPHASRTKFWVQAMCAFQMLSVDLLALVLLLTASTFWDLGPIEPHLLLGIGVLFLAWAAVWIIQLRLLNRPEATLFGLPQWVIWLICAALVFAGR